jgi:hypothetical protein
MRLGVTNSLFQVSLYLAVEAVKVVCRYLGSRLICARFHPNLGINCLTSVISPYISYLLGVIVKFKH